MNIDIYLCYFSIPIDTCNTFKRWQHSFDLTIIRYVFDTHSHSTWTRTWSDRCRLARVDTTKQYYVYIIIFSQKYSQRLFYQVKIFKNLQFSKRIRRTHTDKKIVTSRASLIIFKKYSLFKRRKIGEVLKLTRIFDRDWDLLDRDASKFVPYELQKNSTLRVQK